MVVHPYTCALLELIGIQGIRPPTLVTAQFASLYFIGGYLFGLPLFWVANLGWYAGAVVFFQSARQLCRVPATRNSRSWSSPSIMNSVEAPWRYAAKYWFVTWFIAVPINIFLLTILLGKRS